MGFWDFAAGVGNGLINSIGSALTGNAASKSLMRYQAKLNQQAIDQMNRYNSPIEQMKRLRAAGLNENLAYGSGVDGNQSGSANVGISNRNPAFDAGLTDALELSFKRRQIQNETKIANANEVNILANRELAQAKTLLTLQDVYKGDKTMDTYVAQAKANLQHTQQSIAESQQRVEESKQRVTNMQEQVKQIQATVKNLDARTVTERLRPSEIRSQIRLNNERSSTTAKQRELYDSMIRLNDKKIEELVSLITHYDLENGLDALELEFQQRMQATGLKGVNGRDILNTLKDILLALLRGK